MLKDVLANHLVNAVVAFIFAATGPVAIMLGVGLKTGLSNTELASWIFGAYFINGLVSFVVCLVFRQPLVFLWSIPGIVLVGTAVDHLTFAEIVGAYIVTGVLLIVIGASGLLPRVIDILPMPIVMGMVAGVLLQFGLDWIRALPTAPLIAVPMTLAYLGLSAWSSASRIFPPMIASLLVGILAVAVSTEGQELAFAQRGLFTPVIFLPSVSHNAIIELVVPLMITVIFVQNGQGIALLRAAGHHPPVRTITAICGSASIVSAFTGTVSTCLTGPVNGILAASGERRNQFIGGIIAAVLCMAFGLAAPMVTDFLIAAPMGFVATLGGLALLPVLQGAFTSAFSGEFPKSALIAFMVTISNIELANIGAPFWGLVAGLIASWTLERITKN